MFVSEKDLKLIIRQMRGSESQDKFSQRFYASKQAVHTWENGTRIPSSKVLKQMGIERVFLVKSV